MAAIVSAPSPQRHRLELIERVGRVVEVKGNAMESEGPDAFVGEVCEVYCADDGKPILAEVVGFREGRVCLTPFEAPRGVFLGARVLATGRGYEVPIGPGLLGRVVNPQGDPLDGHPQIHDASLQALQARTAPVMSRRRIEEQLETGVGVIDTFLALGRGQRMGLFSGSGVGKSTLMGMICRGVRSDVNVVALIGERGREVREFVEDHLGEQGLSRSVVVVATADSPAIFRVNAAYYATAIAEYFRDQGLSVLLTMDSLTRFAIARREIGLAVGEPPTARGYTPSVFSEIPALCERCGTSTARGSITGVYTVLVDGDDMNEPISDTARATLDGHIVLSRELSSARHFPPVDILQSVSRLSNCLGTLEQRTLLARMTEYLAIYDRNRQLIEIGAYRAGNHPLLDRAVGAVPKLLAAMRQDAHSNADLDALWNTLATIMSSTDGAH